MDRRITDPFWAAAGIDIAGTHIEITVILQFKCQRVLGNHPAKSAPATFALFCTFTSSIQRFLLGHWKAPNDRSIIRDAKKEKLHVIVP
jgi:hypothetical protein